MNKKIKKTQKRPKLDINELAFSIVVRATGDDDVRNESTTEKATTTEVSQPQPTPSEPMFHKQ